MLNNQIGTVEVISFRTTRVDPEYKYPVEGVLLGTSVSHLALRLTFTDQQLFAKYVAGNKNIPYVDNLITESGQPAYQVYFSFWPISALGLGNVVSRLNTHVSDCEQSALGSPMTYAPRFTKYLHPDEKLFASMIPILNLFLKTEATLPPAMIFHTTHFKTRLALQLQKLFPGRPQAELDAQCDEIITLANSYCTCFKAWVEATINKQSIANANFSSNSDIAAATMQVNKTNATLQTIRNKLKDQVKAILFANSNISDEDFNSKLEDYFSFGKPETDTTTLPLVQKSSTHGAYGLELEPMLRLIKDIADNPKKYQYNLLSNNCATIALVILNCGAKLCSNRALRKAFTLPWYARLLDFPVSPTMVMDLTANAQNITGMIQTRQELFLTHEAANQCKIAVRTPRIIAPVINSNECILTSYDSAKITADIQGKSKLTLKR